MSDIHNQASATYFNTVRGGKVYLDNCANTVGTYSMNQILETEYCGMIPYEFHGQKVWGYNVNPERADIEMLNDASTLNIFGLKIEGPGMAVKTVNGGQTNVFMFLAAIGNPNAKHALFYTDIISNTTVIGGNAYASVIKDHPENGFRIISKKGTESILRSKIEPCSFDLFR